MRDVYEDRKFTFERNLENPGTSRNAEDFEKLRRKLLSKMNEIHEICIENRVQWQHHTKKLHVLTEVQRRLKFQQKPTQAFCKFYEIVTQFPEVVQSDKVKNAGVLRSMHLCEGPGYFIAGLDRFLCTNLPFLKWEWKANTLNPHCENIKSSDMLLDDCLIVNHYENWVFGDDDTGDILKITPEFCRTSGLSGKFDLITADGSFYVQDQPDQQELKTFNLIKAEIDTCLELISKSGCFIFKMFTMFNEETRNLFRKIASKFEKCVVVKPICSKPGNSERYVVCINYDSMFEPLQISDEMFFNCEELFTNRQVVSISYNLHHFQSRKISIEKKRRNRIVDSCLKMLETITIRESHLMIAERQPWTIANGHNIVEKIHNINTIEMAKTQLKEYCEYSKTLELTWNINHKEIFIEAPISTSSPLQTNHSLFLNPLILHALNLLFSDKILDLFSKCSKIAPARPEIRHFCETGNELLIYSTEIEGFDEILNLLDVISRENYDSIIFTWKPYEHPLILTRFSSSVIALFSMFYEEITFCSYEFRLTGKKPDSDYNISKFRNTFATDMNFIINFVPICTHAAFHTPFSNFNELSIRNILRNNEML